MISVDPTLAHPIACEPPPRPSRLWAWARNVSAIALAAGLGAGSWFLWRDGTLSRAHGAARSAAIAFSAEIGFQVNDMLVMGRQETDAADLLNAVQAGRGSPILAFDAARAKARVEALPWVQTAAVERVLPDTVIVRIQERKPLAVWQNQGRFHLIDRTGTVIPGVTLERFGHLLRVVGEDAPQTVADLVRLLTAEPELAGRVKAAVRVGARRWNLRLDNGMDVRLPEQDAAIAWGRLADYERSHKLLERDIQILDLRLPDRLIVRRPDETPVPPPVAGKAQKT